MQEAGIVEEVASGYVVCAVQHQVVLGEKLGGRVRVKGLLVRLEDRERVQGASGLGNGDSLGLSG